MGIGHGLQATGLSEDQMMERWKTIFEEAPNWRSELLLCVEHGYFE